MEWELASLDLLLPPHDDGLQPPSQPLHATQVGAVGAGTGAEPSAGWLDAPPSPRPRLLATSRLLLATDHAHAPLRAPQELFVAKPEIKHAHRAPERRAPAIVPLLFVGAALAPLAALGAVLLRLGANLKVGRGATLGAEAGQRCWQRCCLRWQPLAWPLPTAVGRSCNPHPHSMHSQALPTGGAGALWAIGFHGGLAATLALLFLFWLRLTLMQLLPLLGGLGAFTAACGSRALAHAAAARKKAE